METTFNRASFTIEMDTEFASLEWHTHTQNRQSVCRNSKLNMYFLFARTHNYLLWQNKNLCIFATPIKYSRTHTRTRSRWKIAFIVWHIKHSTTTYRICVWLPLRRRYMKKGEGKTNSDIFSLDIWHPFCRFTPRRKAIKWKLAGACASGVIFVFRFVSLVLDCAELSSF